MNIMKLVIIAIFLFSAIFLGTGLTIYFMPLNYITINGVRQVATPENTRVFRLIFLSVFGGIGFIAFIVGVILAKKVDHTK